jgi:hypothetical protein
MKVLPSFKKATTCAGLLAALAGIPATAQVTGPSTTTAPYVEPMTTNVTFISIFTTGDSVNLKPDGVTPYRMVGIPDGLGAFDNNDGTFTVLMNQELVSSVGINRAHGAKGAFVSKWIINKSTLAVLNGSDLITNLWLLDTNTFSYVKTNYAAGRFCSADLPATTALYNATSGYGTTNRIFFSGEESAPASSRLFAHVVTGPEAQNSYDLPWLGKMSWENALANPVAQNKTVVGCNTDDGTTDSFVYFWVGNKTNSGMEIVKAGFVSGNLYVVSVSGLAQEVDGTTAATRTFSLVNISALTNVVTASSTQLKGTSLANGGTTFMRVEDGAWDPTRPNDYYFNTTASISQPSRLWRLRFTDITQPELGGVCDMMLDGTEGQKMMDNLCVDANGDVIENEDPGNNARISRIWKYTPALDTFVALGQVKSNLFLSGVSPSEFQTQDEEFSGVIDMSSILGAGKYLFVLQNHKTTNDVELVEGGQLLLMQTIFPGQVTGPSTATAPYVEPMTTNVTFTSIFTTGDSVNNKPNGVTPYRMVGIPDGLGAFDNNDGTFTLLMNQELTTSVGTNRAHGPKGAFVSKWVINKATLAVQNGSDLITNLWLLDTNTYSYVSTTNYAIGRLCSADLPPVSALYNATSGYGTTNRIFLSGEESAPTSARLFAHVVTGPEAQNSYDLPWLGKMSWENALANPVAQNKTVVGCDTDDGTTDSFVYFWVGNKTNVGYEVEKAGLVYGNLHVVSVSGLTQEVDGTTAATRNFSLVNVSAITNVVLANATQLKGTSLANGGTTFQRVEDGAWDPTHPNDYYFNTTASITGKSRLWRLRFTDITHPELGGVCDMMLDGTEGQIMMDNLCVDATGNVIENEDPGNNARVSRIWKYYPTTDAMVPLGQVKSNLFLSGVSPSEFLTQDEEFSGVIDASSILGAGKYLFVLQNHKTTNDVELVEGGQLLMMQTYAGVAASSLITGQPSSTSVNPGGNATFTVTVPAGSWVQWYRNGSPIAGANSASYTTSVVGSYYAIVGNSSGSVTSSSVTLTTTSIALYAGLTVTGPVGTTYNIQYTTSLSGTPVWTTLGTLTLTSSSMIYLDTTVPANQPARFYRAVAQ